MPKSLTVRPELLRLDLSGKLYIVTGANSGIGWETSRQLAAQGATVVMACRRIYEGEGAAAAIRAKHPAAKLDVQALDLGDLHSVRSFAKGILNRYSRLDGLVNNAGVMNTALGRTKDGFETQFGINHIGHFLLTELLTDMLKVSAPSRVAILASSAHEQVLGRKAEIHFDDLNFEHRKYDGWEAYSQSKLANVLHARELARRLSGTGVVIGSIHPGVVHTNLFKTTIPPWLHNYVLRPVLRLVGMMIEPWEGAQTTLHVLLAPEVAQQSGAFFSQASGSYKDKRANRGGWPMESPNPLARDDETAQRLWGASAKLVGLSA
ncbi:MULTISPECIES: SDR family oxidoreductase [unclassified Burkholderia]|uniref:SDR family oxidoreductase n=1 Tax=unclassified Burkholderia TaxID=2613784 RepID=UPI002AB1F248|nr:MULTISPECIES: SDR family oxidoreductase [unclassified Burkholderia]